MSENGIEILLILSILIELILAIAVMTKVKILNIKLAFFILPLVNIAWLFSVFSADPVINPNDQIINSTELIRYAIWFTLLVSFLMNIRKEKFNKTLTIKLLTMSFLLLTFLLYINNDSDITNSSNTVTVYIKIISCLACIVICEQIIRHNNATRMTKLISLISILTLALDIIVMSSYVLSINTYDSYIGVRLSANTFQSLILTMSVILYSEQIRENTKFKFSNSILMFNSSIILCGLFLIVISILNSFIIKLDLMWSNVLHITIYLVSIFCTISLLMSEKFRRTIIVVLSKHIFDYKHDFKEQWTKLDNQLTNTKDTNRCYEKSLKSIINIFQCTSGAIWIKGDNLFSLISTYKMDIDDSIQLFNNDDEFILTMEHNEWIYELGNEMTNLKYNSLLPTGINEINNAWVLIPLINSDKLTGFILLCKPKIKSKLTWEDIDLFNLAGRQVASFISNHQQLDTLNHNKQFDNFNKLTAFAIHDIKNIIAQQKILVHNSIKHKNNPDFIDDAISTISQSVIKMDRLLLKLKEKDFQNNSLVDLNKLISKVVNNNSTSKPVPIYINKSEITRLNTDEDRLTAILNHLISNAKDATDEHGKVQIDLESDEKNIIIRVADSGCGMEKSFLNKELFQPFFSTKETSGMGIGAFQIKELIKHLHGELIVKSEKDIGSTFSIYLPIS